MGSDIIEGAIDAPISPQPSFGPPAPDEFFANIVDTEFGLTVRDVIRIASDGQVGLAELLSTMFRGKFAGEIQLGSTKDPTIYAFNGIYWEIDAQRCRKDYARRLLNILSAVHMQILAAQKVTPAKFLQWERKVVEDAQKIVQNIRIFNVVVDKAFEGQNGCGVISSKWDQDKLTLTTCANIVDLRTGAIIPPNPEEYRRQHTNVEYFEKLDEPAAFISMIRESLSLIGYPEPPVYADERELEDELNSTVDPDDDLSHLFDPDPNTLTATQRNLDQVRRSNAELRARYDQQMALWSSGRITDEVVSFMQVLLGYCILGTNPNEKFLIFVGDKGRNGKGLISHTLRNILGDYAFEARSETFMKSKQRGGGEATSDIMALKGRRVVFISENDRGDAINASLIKRITGHDEMAGRELYGKEQTFAPSCVPILLTNFFPHIDSEDHALLRRCICIPFQRTFKENPDPENPAEGLIDYGLEEKLKAEYPQILCWLVQGAIRFLEEGLNVPDYIEAAAEGYRKDKDILGIFLNVYCTTDDFPAFRANEGRKPASILSSQLYGAFAQWCLECNLKPCSAVVFRQRMQAKGFEYTKNSNIYVQGLRFQNQAGSDFYEAYMSRHRREFRG